MKDWLGPTDYLFIMRKRAAKIPKNRRPHFQKKKTLNYKQSQRLKILHKTAMFLLSNITTDD